MAIRHLLALLLTASIRGETPRAAEFEVTDSDGSYHLLHRGQEVIAFRHALQAAPPGVSPAYGRSGFWHPLRAPHGQVLTQIQPADHYHHYGLWAPWTHVEFRGQEHDFWNLGDRKGLVRFSKPGAISASDDSCTLSVELEHVVGTGAEETLVLRETQTVKVSTSPTSDVNIIDLALTLRCATDDPVTLKTYRYGGVGWRATAEWNRDNCTILTSEGRSRRDADGSHARWCLVQGSVDQGKDEAGVLWLANPSNQAFPEPLRVWPEDQNGRGDVFVNFCPTKEQDWVLQPGKSYSLHYRLIVFNGHLSPTKAESLWQTYASAPHPVAPRPRLEPIPW